MTPTAKIQGGGAYCLSYKQRLNRLRGQLKYSEMVATYQNPTEMMLMARWEQTQKNAYPDSSSLLYILKFTPQFDLCSSDVSFTFEASHSRVDELN